MSPDATQAKGVTAGGGKRRAKSLCCRFLGVPELLLACRDSLPKQRLRKPGTRDALTSSQIIKLSAEVKLNSNACWESHVIAPLGSS
jgi:hypothetical protein